MRVRLGKHRPVCYFAGTVGDTASPSETACAHCKNGVVERGTTTATFETDGAVVVIRNVPARVCNACGQGDYDALTTERLLTLAASAAGWSGAPVQICDYTTG